MCGRTRAGVCACEMCLMCDCGIVDEMGLCIYVAAVLGMVLLRCVYVAK